MTSLKNEALNDIGKGLLSEAHQISELLKDNTAALAPHRAYC